ncbi:MAG: Pyruvate/ketoisovalerate oxidoreductase, catalytic domain protein [Sporomusa sp.]|jgi:2-oxoglutarate ferredoxin oxidoreductase subunit gamma|nr:Pyruvate/ketoisovalerate oxidoreductase, catalytic domain protein [Sporomusa sp.]
MGAYEVTISGFGGQGVLLIGQLLAYAANKAGHTISWLPAYGPEMRGGTANCMVVISDGEVNSPQIINPTAVIALNKPSVQRFEPLIKTGGLLIVNTDLVDIEIQRKDISVVKIAAGTIAEKLGSNKIVNMVALGAFIKASGIVSLNAILQCLENVIPAHRASMIEVNAAAIKTGYEAVAE